MIADKLITKIREVRAGRGQSLVEMAIAAPLLIFMLIGLFEVGWALRGYITLVNANREATRFAVRPGYLDYSEIDPALPDYGVGYDEVRDHVFTTLADQLGLTFDEDSTLIVTHMVIDTGWPCAREDVLSNNPNACECEKFLDEDDPPDDELTYDDLIIYPFKPGYEEIAPYYVYTYPVSTTHRTRIDYVAETERLARENNRFNCELLKSSNGAATPSANNVVITELFYGQPQLFGFPFISNPLLDPVPMYTHTTMRITGAPRSEENVDAVGDLCMALPFTIRNTYVNTATVGVTQFDILAGAHPEMGLGNERGFLAWDPQWQNTTDLEVEFRYPRTAFNSYANDHNPTDHGLSVGDYVQSLPGNNNASAQIRDFIQGLIDSGETFVVPVWDHWDGDTSSYRISTFIRVRLLNNPPFHLTSNNPEVWAVYLGPATECLP